MKRSYGQFCGVARALDVLGERWTLLVVRELIVGPQRFKDLLDSLPGIGTNLLAARLRDLERDGLIGRRKLPRPAGSTVYELEPLGRELEPIVLAIGRWGRKLLEPRAGDQRFQGRWLLFALRANFVAARARRVRETYELRIGGDVVHARVSDGRLDVAEGAAGEPDLVVEASLDVLLALARGDTTPAAEIKAGKLATRGSRKALERFWSIFDGAGLPPGQTAVA
ncbi:MAG: winged helix-turn-helix transcriptional regulator [Candidatus Binatia bacterium]